VSERTIVVVGGTSGIGLEIAREIVARGDRVVLTGRDLDRARHVAASVGDRATGVAVDISEPETIAERLSGIGAVHGLVLAAIERDANSVRDYDIARARRLVTLKLVGYTETVHTLLGRLEETVALLRTTRRQLVAAEKLAALGEVTAGVAHEINNPIAIIQGNLEIIRAELGPAAQAVDTEIELILDQVHRIHVIVDNLLRYSRPIRRARQPLRMDTSRLIADALVLVEHEAAVHGVTVRVEHAAHNQVAIDAQEFQQVMVGVAAGDTVFIRTGRGNITVEPSSDDTLRVRGTVTWRGRGRKPRDIAAKAERVAGGFFVGAMFGRAECTTDT